MLKPLLLWFGGKYEFRCPIIQELLEMGAHYVYMQNQRIQVH